VPARDHYNAFTGATLIPVTRALAKPAKPYWTGVQGQVLRDSQADSSPCRVATSIALINSPDPVGDPATGNVVLDKVSGTAMTGA